MEKCQSQSIASVNHEQEEHREEMNARSRKLIKYIES